MRYYFIQNETEAIFEVQRYLTTLFYLSDGERVAGDGIFGAETESAVKEFQRKQGIAETGSVDQETFELLFLAYRDVSAPREENRFPFSSEALPASAMRNGRSREVEMLQEAILSLFSHYGERASLRKSGYFDPATQRAVKRLQHIFREEETGVVTDRLYQRLLTAIEAEGREY